MFAYRTCCDVSRVRFGIENFSNVADILLIDNKVRYSTKACICMSVIFWQGLTQ